VSIFYPAHKKADAWTSAFQTPFGKTLSDIVDPLNKAAKAGTLTYQQAKDALDEYTQQWDAFQKSADQFKAMGGDYAKAVNQGFDPNGDFMKTVTGVKKTLTDYVNSLPPPSGDPSKPSTPPDPNHPSGTGGQSSTQAARNAAVLQSKRNAAAPGFISTILGGAGLDLKTQRKTLVGY
jgi:hypothetical protein